jgi:predicted ABC-type ATPase
MPRPRLWIIAGPNGAGKTTVFTKRLRGRIAFVNADEIAQDMPRIDGRLDEAGAGREAVRRRTEFIAQRKTFAIETTLSGQSAMRLMQQAKDRGYKILFVYIGIDSPELSRIRVDGRVIDGGHDVPTDAIMRRYPDSLRRLSPAMALADRSWVFDNTGKTRRLLLARNGDRLRFVATDLPPWLTTSGNSSPT